VAAGTAATQRATSDEATGDSASADGGDEATGDCVKLKRSFLNQIDDGLIIKAKSTDGQAVELADDQKDLGVEYVAAVNVESPTANKSSSLASARPWRDRSWLVKSWPGFTSVGVLPQLRAPQPRSSRTPWH